MKLMEEKMNNRLLRGAALVGAAFCILNLSAADLDVVKSDGDNKKFQELNESYDIPKEVIDCYRRILSMHSPWRMFVTLNHDNEDNRAVVEKEYAALDMMIRAWHPTADREKRFKKIARASVEVQRIYLALQKKKLHDISAVHYSFILENAGYVTVCFFEFLQEYGIPLDAILPWAERHGFDLADDEQRVALTQALHQRAERSQATIRAGTLQEALMIALHNNNPQERETEIRELIKNGAVINGMDNFGIPPLLYAVSHDDIPLINFLLKTLSADPNYRAKSGAIPLIHARSDEVSKLLIGAGANIDYQGPYGETPLMTAAETDSLIVVKGLLENDAEIDAVSEKNGETAIQKALKNQHHTIFRLLNKAGASMHITDAGGETFLMAASKLGAVSYVKVILQNHNIDVNAANSLGETALMKAIENGHAEIVKLLLERGADIRIRTKTGKSVLDSAFKKFMGHACATNECEHKKLFELLLVELEKLVPIKELIQQALPAIEYDSDLFENEPTPAKTQTKTKKKKSKRTAGSGTEIGEKEQKKEDEERARLEHEERVRRSATEIARKAQLRKERERKEKAQRLNHLIEQEQYETSLLVKATKFYENRRKSQGIAALRDFVDECQHEKQLVSKADEFNQNSSKKRVFKALRDLVTEGRNEDEMEEALDELEAEKLGLSTIDLQRRIDEAEQALKQHGNEDVLDSYSSIFPLCKKDSAAPFKREISGAQALAWYEKHKMELFRIYGTYKGKLLCPHCSEDTLLQP